MVKKFAEKLVSHRKLGLISHISPDGDAIGSQLGLYYWLKQMGVEAEMFNDDHVPSNLAWLEGASLIQVPDEGLLDQCDGFVFVDGNHPSRFGNTGPYFEKTQKPIYLIDHHLDVPEGFFRAMWWDAEASSTAMLVYQLYESTKPELLNKAAAEALYSGVVTDTGSFRFATVTSGTHHAIARIIDAGGIKPAEIHEKLYDDKRLQDLHLLGKALDNIALHHNGQLATLYVSGKMLEQTGCSYEDMEGFVNYPLGIRGVMVSVMFSEREGRVKMSFRGKAEVDLNRFARKFNGGGHFNAAGAWHDGPVTDAIDAVVAEMKKHL
ncbi:bifunctional oligoribonuclease/PAP phosphatase NrnA [Balneolales bacterium ANBcel1]|nr:bifunctional oligoribonuclease/PAP phosphatase NrnA [Balneolales bacterium ANBcel1]